MSIIQPVKSLMPSILWLIHRIQLKNLKSMD